MVNITNKSKRALSLLLTAAMVLGMFNGMMPITYALGEENGNIYYIDSNGVEKGILASDTKEIADDATELTSGFYVIDSNTTLSNRITITGDVSILLADGTDTKIPLGINVPLGSTLTIYGQTNSTGNLTIDSAEADNTAIGGNDGEDAGTIIINGGTIYTKGGKNAAAIGSGPNKDDANATIVINGGNITAIGSNTSDADGIGKSGGGTIDTLDVQINGGIVHASSNVANGGSGVNEEFKLNGGVVYSSFPVGVDINKDTGILINTTDNTGKVFGNNTINTDTIFDGIDLTITDGSNLAVSSGVALELVNGSNLHLSVGSMLVATDATVKLTNNSNLEVDAGARLLTNVLEIDGTVTNNGVITGIILDSVNNEAVAYGNAVINSDTTFDGTKITISDGSKLTIPNGVTVELLGSSDILTEGTGKLISNGIIKHSGNLTSTADGILIDTSTHTGTISGNPIYITKDTTFDSTEITILDGSTLIVLGDATLDLTNNTELIIENGATLEANGLIKTTNGGIITNNGELNALVLNETTHKATVYGDTTITGSFEISNATIIIPDGSSLALSNNATLKVVNGQAVIVKNGATLTIDSGSSFLTDGIIRVDGILVNNGTISGIVIDEVNKTIRVYGDATLKSDLILDDFDIVITENATLTIDDGIKLHNNGEGASIKIEENGKLINKGEIKAESGIIGGTFDNRGTLIECACVPVITGNDILDRSIGTDIGTTILLTDLYEAHVDTSACQFHSGDTVDVDSVSIVIKSESDGTGTITTGTYQDELTGNTITADIFQINDIGSRYTATLEATASYKGREAKTDISVEIKREAKAPSIVIKSYDASTGELKITVKPNGNAKAKIYLIDGTDKTLMSDTSGKTEIQFKMGWSWFKKEYKPADVTVKIPDTYIPNNPTNLKAKRSTTNPKEVILSWAEATDSDHIISLQASTTDKNGDEMFGDRVDQNIKTAKSSDMRYRVYLWSTSKDSEGNNVSTTPELLLDMSRNESVTVRIDKPLLWNSSFSVETFDLANNKSAEIVYKIPDNVIYNPTIVDDTATVEEGAYVAVLAKENDTHDKAFSTPLLSSVEVLDGGAGDVTLVDASQFTDLPAGVSGLLVNYQTTDGMTPDGPVTIKIKYTYAQVRDDIPAASGTVTITVTPRNQEPVAVSDPASVTEAAGIQRNANGVIDIPVSVILANDKDRETGRTPEEAIRNLQVSQVRNVSSGTITYIDSLKLIRIVPSSTFYGVLTFEYRITDGKLVSLNWATVTLNVEKLPDPPVAKDVNTVMELTEKTKAVSLNVKTSGVAYTLNSAGISTVKVNGSPATSDHGITLIPAESESETGEKVPYIKFSIKDTSTLKDKDKVTFTYTIEYEINGVKGTSTANATVEMTSGDDPNDMEGYLYVHRRPIAAFAPIITLDATKSYVTSAVINSTTESSYDLDHQFMHALDATNRPGYSLKGLRAWEWGIKTITGDWNTKVFDVEGVPANSENEADKNKLTSYGTADAARAAGLAWIQSETTSLINSLNAANNHESIIVSLRVRDIDNGNTIGVWSDQRTIMLTALPLPPVAQFTLDKSSYTISSTGPFEMIVTDLSYDPNGDTIGNWAWELTDPTGKVIWSQNIDNASMTSNPTYVQTMVANTIAEKIRNPGWNPDKPEFKLSLVVTEDTVQKLESDKYSVTFTAYIDNEAPVIDDSGASLTKNGSTVYEIDDGADGTVGDDWGTETNSNGHPGKINFSSFFTVTDDQDLGLLRMSWLFEGETVQRRKDWSEDRRVTTQKAYSNLKYSPFEAPFINTVTAQGFKPGAYKISVSVKDNPQGNRFQAGAAKTTYWNTYGEPPEAPPYHLYVVPKLDMFTTIEFNGWILSGSFNGDTWVDKSYRISDGATLAEAGLELEDIVPTIGDTIIIRTTTNQYVTNLWGYEDYNQNERFDGEKKFTMTKTKVNLDNTIEWEGTFTIDDIDDAPEGKDFTTLHLRLHGETIWGSEEGNVTRTKEIALPTMVLPVKLYDFRVTSLTDPNLSEIYNGYVNSLIIKGEKLSNGNPVDGALVGHLAVDRNSKSVATSISPIRKGYSFYFSVCSKGLTKDADEVRIYPKLYAATVNRSTGAIEIGRELVGCVPNSRGKYEPYTTNTTSQDIIDTYGLFYEGNKLNSLNSHSDLRIPTSLRVMNGSEQTWYGRYGIPADARFVYADDYAALGKVTSDIEWKGDILVTFETQAFKAGRARYNYVERGQWAKERATLVDALKTPYTTQEVAWKNANKYLGTIIIYDGSKSLRDDYTSNPVWKE